LRKGGREMKNLLKVLGLSLAILLFSSQLTFAINLNSVGERNYLGNKLFKVEVLNKHVNLNKAEVVKAQVKTSADCLFTVKIFKKNKNKAVWSDSFSGEKTLVWDGRDESGNLVSNGEYVIAIKGEKKGVSESEVFSVEVNNNGEVKKEGMDLGLALTELQLTSTDLSREENSVEPVTELAVNYSGAFVAAIEGRVASRFTPQVSGKLALLRLGFSGENIKIYLREDDGGKPGEIIATFDYPSVNDYPYITLKEIDVSQSSVYLEAGKSYWIEGPGVALYSDSLGVTYDWSPWFGVWYNTGWSYPFAMEIYVQK